VLAPDVELAGLDARHWRNAWRLFTPPGVRDRPRWALIVVDGTPPRPIKAVIGGDRARGAIELVELGWTSAEPAALAAIASRLDVGAVIVVARGLFAELAREIDSALRLDQHGAEQALITWRAIKLHAGRALWVHPPLLELLPAPGLDPLQRTFDLLVPDGSALVGYVIEDDRQRVHTAVIAIKEGGQITRVLGHRAIADLVDERQLASDWRRHRARVLAAVEERFAKPAIGVFVERATLLGVMTGPSDQLARELDADRIAIDPAPAWLLGLLGGAAVAAIAGRAASMLASMLPQRTRDRASALRARAETALKESGAHPFALLGFDPLALWAELKRYYRDDARSAKGAR